MVKLLRPMTRTMRRLALPAIAAAILVFAPCAFAGAAKPPAPAAGAASTAKPSTPTADPRVNAAAIASRVDQELGIPLQASMASWQHQLDDVERELGRANLRYSELTRLRAELEQIRAKVADAAGRLQPRLDADKSQIALLGPAPAAGQPPEPDQAALNRAELNYHYALLSAGQTAVNSANLRIDNLINSIQDVRRKNFASVLFAPIPGVYAYNTWASLPRAVPSAAAQLRGMIVDWWQNVADHNEAIRTTGEALVLCLLLSLAGWRGVRRLRRWQEAEAPPFWRRASAAAGVILLRALPAVVPVAFLYAMTASEQVLPQRIDWLFYLTAQSIVIVFAVGALVSAALAPRAPQWRLVAISDAAAAQLTGLVIVLAVVYSLTSLLYIITRLVQAPFALTIGVALPSNLILAALVVALLRFSRSETTPPRLIQAVRMVAWGMVAAIVICALAGYLPLARFLSQQLVVTGSILALVYLLLLWVDGFTQGLSDDGAVAGRWLKRRAGLERARREQLSLPISLFLKFAVLVLAVPLIMLQWGYSWPDIREWYRQLFFGFHIGNTEVTFGALFAAVLVFGLGYAAARLFQGWLDAQVLQPAGISGGVRNSIRTGVGYVGIIIAALVAFSYAGFNLSSLAIVAGALSVGIGFGLQNLVNNFVSGLILLVERPIRVGDQVVVGGEEGYVRKISVRSTEIETFDRANVLVPNSYFISEKVKNWTFRNNVRRLSIAIGVAYGSDVRQVHTVLLDIARAHADVLRVPEPAVTLDEFAASSITFTLYAYIGDINKTGRVRTELAMAILDAFAATGIAIPFGQTDVAIRNMDWLRDAVAQLGPQVAAPAVRKTGNEPAIHLARTSD